VRASWQPRLPHAVRAGLHDMGPPLLPGVATGSEIMAAQATA
jgi:2-keto-3-deoxy-6-phosphogluconate aldolase